MKFRDYRFFCLGLFILSALVLSLARDSYADAPVTIVHINAGDEAVLEDGRTLHIQGVKAPIVGSGALSEQAIDLLHTLTDHVPLFLDNQITDRYGRLTAQIYLMQEGKKIWLEQILLRHGLVFVYLSTGSEVRVDDMLSAEADAYRKHLGIWGDPTYADTPARQTRDLYGHFAFVTGKVTKAERTKNIIYLTFGAEGHPDFNVAIAARYMKAFRQAGVEPLAYQGKMVRVRGWIKRDSLPVIAVTSPYQIQIIDKD